MSERIVTRHITPHTAWQGPESEAPVSPAGEASVPKVYNIGDRTMAAVFEPAGLKNLSDLQAVFDQVEIALSLAGEASVRRKVAYRSTPGIVDVLSERERQVVVEGWTPEHDDQHCLGEMAAAAVCYAFEDIHPNWVKRGAQGCNWPWADEWWKPRDRRRNLVKAAALIIAEIDRIDRAAAKDGS